MQETIVFLIQLAKIVGIILGLITLSTLCFTMLYLCIHLIKDERKNA